MIPTLILAAAIAPNTNNLSAAAIEDSKQFVVDGKRSPSIYYIVADPVTNGVLRWVLTSSSVQPEVELCVPQPVAPNLYRIDIDALGWRFEDWKQVLSVHPYGGFSMLVRGDWLVTEILDCALSASQHEDGIPAYYRLLYRGKPPQNEQELLAFWEIDDVVTRRRGAIEGVSQVNRRGRRWIESRSRHDGYFWITRDSLRLNVGSDPLEDPSGKTFAHDGSEAIIGLNKVSSDGFTTGAVQFYHLGNGKGETVFEAPVQLVEDSTRFRNVASIRTWGSCLQCHVEGIRPIDENVVLSLNDKYGIWTVPADGKNNQVLADIRRFHFGDLSREIRRNSEDYEAGVKMVTGWTVRELIEATESVVRGYDAALTLEKAALELGTTADLLKTNLIEYSQLREGKFAFGAPAGLLMMAGGGTASRDLFAQQFSFLDNLVKHGGVGTHAHGKDRGRSTLKVNSGTSPSAAVPPSGEGNQAGSKNAQNRVQPRQRQRFIRR